MKFYRIWLGQDGRCPGCQQPITKSNSWDARHPVKRTDAVNNLQMYYRNCHRVHQHTGKHSAERCLCISWAGWGGTFKSASQGKMAQQCFIVTDCLTADEPVKLKFKKERRARDCFALPMAKVSSMDERDSLSVNLAFWDMCEYLYRQLSTAWVGSNWDSQCQISPGFSVAVSCEVGDEMRRWV